MSSFTLMALEITEDAIVDQAVALLNRTQGDGLFTRDYILNRAGNPNSLVLSAFEGEKFIGISSVSVISNFDYYMPFGKGISEKLATKRVASMETASVLESYQGLGVGRLMLSRRLEWARAQNCEMAVGVGWQSGKQHRSSRTFEGAGFSAVRGVEKFYLESSTRAPFDCPGCTGRRTPFAPCVCAAVMYTKDL